MCHAELAKPPPYVFAQLAFCGALRVCFFAGNYRQGISKKILLHAFEMTTTAQCFCPGRLPSYPSTHNLYDRPKTCPSAEVRWHQAITIFVLLCWLLMPTLLLLSPPHHCLPFVSKSRAGPPALLLIHVATSPRPHATQPIRVNTCPASCHPPNVHYM